MMRFSDQEVGAHRLTEFVDSFTEALRKGAQATDEFKSKLTSFAVAEFGNVQMYAGKNKISEELFSIILRRQKASKVITGIHSLDNMSLNRYCLKQLIGQLL